MMKWILLLLVTCGITAGCQHVQQSESACPTSALQIKSQFITSFNQGNPEDIMELYFTQGVAEEYVDGERTTWIEHIGKNYTIDQVRIETIPEDVVETMEQNLKAHGEQYSVRPLLWFKVELSLTLARGSGVSEIWLLAGKHNHAYYFVLPTQIGR